MVFDLPLVAFYCVCYMLVLFGIAFITERGWIPDSVVRHPLTYILSLGIVASAWEFYGIVDLADQFGYGALAYYLGVGAIFIFAPVALAPLTEIARRYQVRSLADLLVFRYHNHSVGVLATLCMCLAVIPLLALQLQAVSDTLTILTAARNEDLPLTDTGFSSREVLALIYCVILAIFTVLFGSSRDKHRGLITAMAFESLLKVCALCAVGLFAVHHVFGGMSGLDNWLQNNSVHLDRLYAPVQDSASHTLLIIFLATAVAMPHIFHMSVVENPVRNAIRTVGWAFPLFLLFMALPIFPILWAGKELQLTMSPEYFTLGVPLESGSPALTMLAFLGGLSASTGALVAISLALTTMLLNQWLLPILKLNARWNIFHLLLWLRRGLIFGVFIAGFLFYQLVHSRYNLTDLALLGFIQALQFLPGIIAIAYWPRANSKGFLAGLSVGTLVWGFGLFLPTIVGINAIELPNNNQSILLGFNQWNAITLWSLSLNILVFVGVSLFTKTSDAEHYSAELCSADEISHPVRNTLDISSAGEFKSRLADRLGADIAEQEVDRALRELELNRSERRPYALRRLRNRLEANLSGLFGISVAGEILDEHIPYKIPTHSGSADINLIERRFERDNRELSGVAAELNNLRLYYRKTLQELPMAICSLGPDLEVLTWNNAMAELTGIDSDDVTGSHLSNLIEPWHTLIADFSADQHTHTHRQATEIDNHTCWYSLHKALIEGPVPSSADCQVILIEDVTELQRLENELIHSERLASVGRLAAGVAHEIGNPVTGIACLAQNIQYETKDKELLESAEQILEQTDRITRIVQSLVSFSHAGSNHAETYELVHLSDCADEAIHLLSLQKDKTEVHYDNQLNESLVIRGDAQRLIQVFVNLLSNARDASPAGGRIPVTGAIINGMVTVSIEDEGHGIPANKLGQILEPFYTTKEPGEGTGLGLSMVYSIVTDHEGQIEIQSPVNEATGRGARFTLQFPA
ncbi:two-component system sensor histidine kinase CbrA [Aurantivibrio plasticivorans]